MKSNILLRVMTVSDIPQVCQVWAWAGLGIADEEREKYELAMVLKMNPKACLVACVGGTIVGTVIGVFNGRRVWIYHLAVLPKWQGQGVGSLLLAKLEEVVAKQGATKVLLGVDWHNLKVVPFYEKNGYHVMVDMLLFQKNFYNGAQKAVKGGE